MKKVLLSAAIVLAFSNYAAAQTAETVLFAKTTVSSTTQTLTQAKEETPKEKMSRKERKAAARREAAKAVKISVPVPDVTSKDILPRNGS